MSGIDFTSNDWGDFGGGNSGGNSGGGRKKKGGYRQFKKFKHSRTTISFQTNSSKHQATTFQSRN